jgi:hypothetical protein
MNITFIKDFFNTIIKLCKSKLTVAKQLLALFIWKFLSYTKQSKCVITLEFSFQSLFFTSNKSEIDENSVVEQSSWLFILLASAVPRLRKTRKLGLGVFLFVTVASNGRP